MSRDGGLLPPLPGELSVHSPTSGSIADMGHRWSVDAGVNLRGCFWSGSDRWTSCAYGTSIRWTTDHTDCPETARHSLIVWRPHGEHDTDVVST